MTVHTGQPPGPSRDFQRAPVPMPPSDLTTPQTVNTPAGRASHDTGAFSATPSWSPPDTSRCLFPDRSPRQPSANAARGGLRPPPEGRSRGATKPSSPAQHDKKITQLPKQPPRLDAHTGKSFSKTGTRPACRQGQRLQYLEFQPSASIADPESSGCSRRSASTT